MNVQQAAKLLGGEARGDQVLCPGPNHSAKDRSLSVKFSAQSPEGFVCRSFADDSFEECRDHVKATLGIERDRKPIQFRPALISAPDTTKAALSIWSESIPVQNTLADRYLRSRLITSHETASDLRFNPSLKYDDKTRFPALVALYRDLITDEPCGIHRTFLKPDGTKLDRKMLGRAGHAAIKLDAHEKVTSGLHIGEGIETVLSGRQYGLVPAWACTSAGAIAEFPALPGIECLTVMAEIDPNGTGARALKKVASVWLSAGRSVSVCAPLFGKDINDAARALL